ncbi:DUF4241 domain-containing protein [Hymenobacter humi]|uniref:DUF4241 domain-containing protein n=1 Tax=Hymenobacter humi TaxID=1411620 RepID=A0ABW2U7V4_9BACT
MRQSEIVFYTLLTAALLSGYSYQKSYQQLVQPVSTETTGQLIKPDTAAAIIKTQFVGAAFPKIFEAAYHQNTQAISHHDSISFRVDEIGKLKIESGQIIACDPIAMHDGVAFSQKFPIGQFAVQLALARWDNDERVAFSRILFSNKAVVRWDPALEPGQNPVSMKDSTIYCYGVDGGSGIFIDKNANRTFAAKSQQDWEYVFLKKAELNGFKGFVHDFDQHNLATFPTGFGDGCYATYIGYDVKGEVCRLVTDFGLVNW